MEEKFILFSCCIPVKGARRSTICDIQRSKYYFIPNFLYSILTESPEGVLISSVKAMAGEEHSTTIDDYFKFLLDQELGFFTKEPERFPKISLDWYDPLKITNAIIDISSKSEHPFGKIFNQLDQLGCAAVQLRFYDAIDPDMLNQILAHTKKSRIRSIQVLLPFQHSFSFETIERVCNENKRVFSFVFHSAENNQSQYYKKLKVIVTQVTEKINDASHCGIIHPRYFTTNTHLFTESQNFNSCLNRKISIDADGEIKQCPSMKKSFGDIHHSDLTAVVGDKEFTAIWAIAKDQVEVCKDCEFRYICTDCRGYTTDGKLHGKPLKCSYDPYEAKWNNEMDNPKSVNFIKHKVEII